MNMGLRGNLLSQFSIKPRGTSKDSHTTKQWTEKDKRPRAIHDLNSKVQKTPKKPFKINDDYFVQRKWNIKEVNKKAEHLTTEMITKNQVKF